MKKRKIEDPFIRGEHPDKSSGHDWMNEQLNKNEGRNKFADSLNRIGVLRKRKIRRLESRKEVENAND